MENSLKKDIILNGTDSIAVYKENGLVYRASNLESYTPIVFNNLKENNTHIFKIGTLLSKSYRIVEVLVDVKNDDEVFAVDEQGAQNASYSGAYFTIIQQGKRVFSRFLQLYAFSTSISFLLLQPDDTLRITPNSNLNSITLYCQPLYLEVPIVISET